MELLRRLEQRWSRFIPTSDLTQLNLRPGQPVPVDPTTLDLVQSMCDAWRFTGRRYDPTVLPGLVCSGYRTSVDDPTRHSSIDPRATAIGEPGAITIDRGGSTVTLPVGTAIDPGGIGKGLAADIVTDHLIALGAEGALVCIGGDLAVAGTAPIDAGWTIGIEDPRHPGQDLATITIGCGGVATSSTRSRRWTGHHGRQIHHLVDPATGRTADTDISAVTVVAASGWLAEAHASALAIATGAGFDDYVGEHPIEAVAIVDDGMILASAALASLARAGAAA